MILIRFVNRVHLVICSLTSAHSQQLVTESLTSIVNHSSRAPFDCTHSKLFSTCKKSSLLGKHCYYVQALQQSIFFNKTHTRTSHQVNHMEVVVGVGVVQMVLATMFALCTAG